MALTHSIRNGISAEDQTMVAAFIRQNGVTRVQPAGLPGNEASRATKELIARRRRAFRKENKI